jgi:hypothetical protein
MPKAKALTEWWQNGLPGASLYALMIPQTSPFIPGASPKGSVTFDGARHLSELFAGTTEGMPLGALPPAGLYGPSTNPATVEKKTPTTVEKTSATGEKPSTAADQNQLASFTQSIVSGLDPPDAGQIGALLPAASDILNDPRLLNLFSHK